MRDLHNNVSPAVALDPAAITTDTTTDGNAIDLQGFESCEFIAYSGTVTDGTYTPVIEESDTGAFAGEENAVADAVLLGTEAAAAFASADDNAVKRIGYVGGKRYVRFTVVSASTTTGVDHFGAIAVRGHARHAPTA